VDELDRADDLRPPRVLEQEAGRVGILLVTSEWSQRASLITFTLVPHRSRVLAAKLLAGVSLAVIGFQVCLAAGLLARRRSRR